MGHYVSRSDRMFGEVEYSYKTTEELCTAFAAKIEEVKARIEERHARVIALREQYQISAERLAQMISLFNNDEDKFLSNYNRQGQKQGEALIPAGVVANFVREYDMIESEQEQVRRMELVSRNILDEQPFYNPRTSEHGVRPCIHKLSDDELEYLGF